MKKIPKEKWIWMPHPAHFRMAKDCQFFLATKVGKYIVSTVGELFPDAPVREIFAESRKVTLEGKGDARMYDYMKKIGFGDIGYERKYETMVFCAKKMPAGECNVCPFRIIVQKEVDMMGYKTAKDAFKGHYYLFVRKVE